MVSTFRDSTIGFGSVKIWSKLIYTLVFVSWIRTRNKMALERKMMNLGESTLNRFLQDFLEFGKLENKARMIAAVFDHANEFILDEILKHRPYDPKWAQKYMSQLLGIRHFRKDENGDLSCK